MQSTNVHGLGPKEKKFCEEYVVNGYAAYKAYKIAYPNAKEGTARTIPYKLLKREDIQAYITELREMYYKAKCIDAQRVMTELARIAYEDPDATRKEKLQALQIMSRNLGLETTNQNVNVKADEGIHITIDYGEEVV